MLGQGNAEPANLGLGIATVLDSVMTASRAADAAAGLDDSAMARTHAGFGMAAANVSHHRQALDRTPLPFASVTVRSDAETACLGAHGGAEGGVLVQNRCYAKHRQTGRNGRRVGAGFPTHTLVPVLIFSVCELGSGRART